MPRFSHLADRPRRQSRESERSISGIPARMTIYAHSRAITRERAADIPGTRSRRVEIGVCVYRGRYAANSKVWHTGRLVFLRLARGKSLPSSAVRLSSNCPLREEWQLESHADSSTAHATVRLHSWHSRRALSSSERATLNEISNGKLNSRTRRWFRL